MSGAVWVLDAHDEDFGVQAVDGKVDGGGAVLEGADLIPRALRCRVVLEAVKIVFGSALNSTACNAIVEDRPELPEELAAVNVDFGQLGEEDVAVRDGFGEQGNEVQGPDAVVRSWESTNDGDVTEPGAQSAIDPIGCVRGLAAFTEADKTQNFAI